MKVVNLASRRFYRMTESIFYRLWKRDGYPPTCDSCGRILSPGMMVLAKAKAGKNAGRARRYCHDCVVKFNIWVK